MLLTRNLASLLAREFSRLWGLICFSLNDIRLVDLAGIPNIGKFGDRRIQTTFDRANRDV